MEVILREDVERLGTRGDLVKVAAGYARNFLLPKRLAVCRDGFEPENCGAGTAVAHLRKEAKLKGEAEELAKLVGAVSITIARKAGEGDHLFGSVTANDIAECSGVAALYGGAPANSAGRAHPDAGRA